MLGNAWITPREDYTRTVSDNALVMTSEFTSLCAHAMPYLTFRELVTEVMSPLLNVLSILPVKQKAVIQFVSEPYPDDWKRTWHLRFSMFYWLLVFLRNPYQWFWPGTYERHLWANRRMKGPTFWANLRVALWEEDESEGDPEVEEAQLEDLELSMQSIHCPFRFLDMHALGICQRKSTDFGHEALETISRTSLGETVCVVERRALDILPSRLHSPTSARKAALGGDSEPARGFGWR